MKRILFLPVICALLLIPCPAQKSKPLPDIEKKQIIKAVLLDTNFMQRQLPADEKKELLYLSKENIPAKFARKIHGINFVLLSPRQIKEKANTLFKYYAFEEFKDDGLKILVSFSEIHQDTRIRCEGCEGSASSVSGIRYEFRKINGKWEGKKLNGYSKGY